MTEDIQYKSATYRLLRGLRRTIPEETPEFTSCQPAPPQKRRVKVVAIYGQPVIAHCVNQGEFLYPKVIGHKIIMLDDDDGNKTQESTDDDREARKSSGSYDYFSMEDFVYLKKHKAYQSIRIKLSSSALDISAWRMRDAEISPAAPKGLMASPASRAWAGCIEATLSTEMPFDVTCNKGDSAGSANKKRRFQRPSSDAISIMPPADIAMPASESRELLGLYQFPDALTMYQTMPIQSANPVTKRDVIKDLVPVNPVTAMISWYKEQLCNFTYGLGLTLTETGAAYKVNEQVEERKQLKKTLFIDLPALISYIKCDQIVQWKKVGQLLDRLVRTGLHVKAKGIPCMGPRSTGDIEIVVRGSNLPIVMNDDQHLKHDTCTDGSMATDKIKIDDGYANTVPSKDRESTGYYMTPIEYWNLRDDADNTNDGSKLDLHIEYRKLDDDEEERIIRVEHLCSSDDEECISAISAKTVYDCHTASTTDDDDDSMFGVLGLYACGQAGVVF